MNPAFRGRWSSEVRSSTLANVGEQAALNFDDLEVTKVLYRNCERTVNGLTEELEDGLRQGIRLGEHGSAGLHQDLGASVLSAFVGHIDVLDTGTGGGQVLFADGELFRGEIEPGLIGANGRAILGQLVDGGFHRGQGTLRVGNGVDRTGHRAGVSRRAHIDAVHSEGRSFGIDGHVQWGRRKEADTVKFLGRSTTNISAELSELRVIKSSVGIALGRILRENCNSLMRSNALAIFSK